MKSSKAIALKNNLYIYVAVMVVISILAINYIRRLNMEDKIRSDFDFIYQAMQEDLRNNVLENKGKGCIMPKLDPFDEDVLINEKKLPTGVCEGKDWVECIFDKCSVAKTVQDDLKDVSCVYRDIVYVGNTTQHLGPARTLNDGQIYRLRKSDFVHVACIGINRLHPGPQFKWSGFKAGLRRVHLRKRSSRGPRLNVAMLCFGAMSKNSFTRKMPESLATLKKMGAFILNGYNIVGDGTSGALFPIFVGDEMNITRSTEFFDAKDCILHQLFKMGYRTAYFGDSPVHGTFKGTFDDSQSLPTDHHLLPLLYSVYGKTRANTRHFCFGDMPLYRLLLNLTHQFTRLNGPRFSFTFITDVNHDEFNMASAADADLASFLHRFHKSRHMKKTMLFVMGAHGSSFSSLREVPQLTLEDHLPLMALVLPDRLKQIRPDATTALAANLDVLTTPFDIHSTLTDVLGIEDTRNQYTVPGADMERGLTLLRPVSVC
ncbi:uncharacterized protein [Choristoneura fumiferana]|uniref:uncharacterized protein n=1 Tax=Choristoneura fumiferana TaxID=7141 RepID=UPI003D15CF17